MNAVEAPVLIDPITAAFFFSVRYSTLCRWRNRGLLVSRLTDDGEKYVLGEVLDFVKPLADEGDAS